MQPWRHHLLWTSCHPARGWWRFRKNSGASACCADSDSIPWLLSHRHRRSSGRWTPRLPSQTPQLDFDIRAGTVGTGYCTVVRPHTAAARMVWLTATTVAAVGRKRTSRHCRNTHPWPVDRDSFRFPASEVQRILGPGRPASTENRPKKKKKKQRESVL